MQFFYLSVIVPKSGPKMRIHDSSVTQIFFFLNKQDDASLGLSFQIAENIIEILDLKASLNGS